MKRHFCFVVVILLGVFLVSCSDDESPASAGKPLTYSNGQPLMPLSVGNQWIMQCHSYYDTIRITGTFADEHGVEWYCLQASLSGDSLGVRLTSEGLVWSDDGYEFRIKYPAALDDQEIFPAWDEPYVVTVLETDVEHTIAGKTYRCIKYGVGDTAKHQFYMYYAPGVGLVHMQRRDYSGQYPVTSDMRVLVSCNLVREK